MHGGAKCENCGAPGNVKAPIRGKLCPACRKLLGRDSKKKPQAGRRS